MSKKHRMYCRKSGKICLVNHMGNPCSDVVDCEACKVEQEPTPIEEKPWTHDLDELSEPLQNKCKCHCHREWACECAGNCSKVYKCSHCSPTTKGQGWEKKLDEATDALELVIKDKYINESKAFEIYKDKIKSFIQHKLDRQADDQFSHGYNFAMECLGKELAQQKKELVENIKKLKSEWGEGENIEFILDKLLDELEAEEAGD